MYVCIYIQIIKYTNTQTLKTCCVVESHQSTVFNCTLNHFCLFHGVIILNFSITPCLFIQRQFTCTLTLFHIYVYIYLYIS